MAITNKQLTDYGFKEDAKGTLAFRLAEEETVYVTFWKNGTKLYIDSIDQPKEQEFIFLEHLSIKGLDLLIHNTARRVRKWKTNQEHIKKLLESGDNTSK
jgi:hypothetical protein